MAFEDKYKRAQRHLKKAQMIAIGVLAGMYSLAIINILVFSQDIFTQVYLIIIISLYFAIGYLRQHKYIDMLRRYVRMRLLLMAMFQTSHDELFEAIVNSRQFVAFLESNDIDSRPFIEYFEICAMFKQDITNTCDIYLSRSDFLANIVTPVVRVTLWVFNKSPMLDVHTKESIKQVEYRFKSAIEKLSRARYSELKTLQEKALAIDCIRVNIQINSTRFIDGLRQVFLTREVRVTLANNLFRDRHALDYSEFDHIMIFYLRNLVFVYTIDTRVLKFLQWIGYDFYAVHILRTIEEIVNSSGKCLVKKTRKLTINLPPKINVYDVSKTLNPRSILQFIKKIIF